jgi:hypothetical protein
MEFLQVFQKMYTLNRIEVPLLIFVSDMNIADE